MDNLTVSTAFLNGNQTSFLFWTEQRFREFLLRQNVGRLPRETQKELVRVFFPRLVVATKRDWSGFLEHDDTSEYTEQDYETFEAVNCLAEMKCPEAVRSLAQLASVNIAKDDRERWMSIRALGIIGDKTVIPAMIPLVYHFNLNTRPWAQITLVRLTGVNFAYDWEAWIDWWNKQNLGPPMEKTKIEWQVAPDVTDAERQEFLDPKSQIQKDLSFVNDILTGNAKIILN